MQNQTQNSPISLLARLRSLDFARLKGLASFDVNIFLSIIIGTLTLIILFASSVIFYLYLYTPVFTSPMPGTLHNASINVQLLERMKERSRAQKTTLNAPLDHATSSDPFTRP